MTGRWLAVSAVLLAVGGLGVAVGGALLPARAAGPILVAAHRGGALLWPENSLLAFKNALGLGVDLLETDVHLSADGEIIVLHDATLERTTTGRGAVREARAADLAGVRLRDRDGRVTEEPLPTLGAFLDVMAPARAGLLLELKAGPDRQRYPGLEEKVLAQLRARGITDRTVVMSFEDETVRSVRALDPAIRTSLLVSRTRVERARPAPADIARWARAVGATDLGIDHRVLDAAVLAAARGAGLRVAAWTVNEDADIRRVLELGVDAVISDRPDLALRLAGR